MNQGIAFARTLRALDADDFRSSKLGLALAIVVLAAWVWWALAARIPQYEVSANVRLDSTGRTAIAYFSAPIRTGQRAIVKRGTFPVNAEILDTSEVGPGQTQVHLRLAQAVPSSAQPLTAQVETERISPVLIALRAAGLAHR